MPSRVSFFPKIGAALCLLGILSVAMATNLGVTGHLYPIAEPDMLEGIHQKLLALQSSGRLAAMQKAVKARVRAHIIRPPAVKGIHAATVARTFYFTPEVTLTHDIIDMQGHIIGKRGTTINALAPKTVSRLFPHAVVPPFHEALVFINGDSAKERHFAMAYQHQSHQRVKIILVRGNLATTSNQLGRIYFDQHGGLCHHFGITATPAVITKVGTRLQIKEVVL